jgi:hypothetical protein
MYEDEALFLLKGGEPGISVIKRFDLIEQQLGSNLTLRHVVGLPEVEQPELLEFFRWFHDSAP